MSQTLWKTLALLCIFLGEACAIGAELLAARYVASHPGELVPIFLRAFGLIVIAGGLLLIGYMLGYLKFRDIWIVGAFSIASIIVVEPILTFLVFKEIPSRGPLIGLVLGILGMGFAVLG